MFTINVRDVILICKIRMTMCVHTELHKSRSRTFYGLITTTFLSMPETSLAEEQNRVQSVSSSVSQVKDSHPASHPWFLDKTYPCVYSGCLRSKVILAIYYTFFYYNTGREKQTVAATKYAFTGTSRWHPAWSVARVKFAPGSLKNTQVICSSMLKIPRDEGIEA